MDPEYSRLLSDDVHNFMRSPVREIFKKVDLGSIYSFAGGYPNASTFPTEDIKRLRRGNRPVWKQGPAIWCDTRGSRTAGSRGTQIRGPGQPCTDNHILPAGYRHLHKDSGQSVRRHSYIQPDISRSHTVIQVISRGYPAYAELG